MFKDMDDWSMAKDYNGAERFNDGSRPLIGETSLADIIISGIPDKNDVYIGVYPHSDFEFFFEGAIVSKETAVQIGTDIANHINSASDSVCFTDGSFKEFFSGLQISGIRTQDSETVIEAGTQAEEAITDPNAKPYIFNLETTKIELHFDKADYDALSDAQKREIKSAFLWSGKGKCWVSRAKEPNLWRPKEVANKLGFTVELREGERLTYGEQLERQAERAEARADRYEGYAANAAKRGEQMQSALRSYHGDNSFFTQPNINSSSGRAFTNYREKLYNRYHRGFEEYRKSDYFNDRAQTARETATNAFALAERRYRRSYDAEPAAA